MKKSYSILVLIAVELVAMYAAYSIVNKIIYSDIETYDERKTESYEVRDKTNVEHIEDGHPDWLRCLYYIPEEKIVRVGSGVEAVENEMQIIGETNHYAVVREGANWNIYGPGGKAVFENDRKILNPTDDAMLYNALEMVDNDRLIADRSTGEYFDLEGKPVSNLYTFFNCLTYTNLDAVCIAVFIFFILVVGLLWYFLLWCRTKKA